MAITYVQTGTQPNDGTGDDLRTSFQKINANFQYLDGKGGENNLAVNLPIQSGQGYGLFYSKGVVTTPGGTVLQSNSTALNFRNIKAGTGIALSVDADYNILVTNTSSQQNAFTVINGDSGTFVANTATTAVTIKGDSSPSNPTPYTTVTVTGNTVSIKHDSRLFRDTAPTLGANLTLNGFDIVGTGNFSNIGTVTTDTLTVGRPTQQSPNPGVISVNGAVNATSGSITSLTTSILSVTNTVTVSNSVTAGSFLGPLTGNTFGTHKGDVQDALGNKIFNSVTDTFTGTDLNPITFSGIHTGKFSGVLNGALSTTDGSNSYNITGSGKLVLSCVTGGLDITNSDTYNTNKLTVTGTSISQTGVHFREAMALKLVHRNNYVVGDGPGIGFTSVDTGPVGIGTGLGTVDHGVVSMMMDQSSDATSAFYVTARGPFINQTFYAGNMNSGNGVTPNYNTIFRATGQAITNFSGVQFNVDNTYPYATRLDIDQSQFTGYDQFPSRDLILTNSSAGFINFYGVYKMPKTLGTAGQALTVPIAGNTLIWSNVSGGGGGGGASYLSALLDGPGPYQVSDRNKILVINNTNDGFLYTNTLTGITLNSSTLNGNAATATALQTARNINGVSFNGTADITFTSDSVSEGSTNQYFTNTRARNAISVTANQPLTYTANTGNFNLNASTSSTPLYLVQRDASGIMTSAGAKINTLAVSTNSQITVNSDLTGTFNITTGATVSANNFVTTGVGIPQIDSQSKIVLNPTTYVDLSSKKISNLLDPTSAQDAASKYYVDTQVGAVSTAAITSIPINANTGGSFNLAKGVTLTIAGGTNISTVTGTNNVTVSLASTISGVNFSSGFSVNGTVSATSNKGGNVLVGGVDGNTISQTQTGSDLTIVPGQGVTPGAVVVNGYMQVNTSLTIVSNETLTIPASSTAVTANVDTNVTFVVTSDWLNDAQANVAYINLPSSNRNGQIKTFKMKSRGQYSTNALNPLPRFAYISGNIDGTSKQIALAYGTGNTASTSGNATGALTLISLNGYWWVIGQY
jgi:hypothetical protein